MLIIIGTKLLYETITINIIKITERDCVKNAEKNIIKIS